MRLDNDMSCLAEIFKLSVSNFDDSIDIISIWFKDVETGDILFLEYGVKCLDYEEKNHYLNNIYYNHLENEDSFDEDFIDENYSCFDFLTSEYNLPIVCHIYYSQTYNRYFICPFDLEKQI